MNKVKHVIVIGNKSLCGRTVNTNGTGSDCKHCASKATRNAATVAAMIPSGNGLVDMPALTEADIVAYGMDETDIAEYNAQRAAEILAPVTFADVVEANGWLNTDVDAVTRVAPGEVNGGFWNCCQARPAVAVEFVCEETGQPVWYAACRGCASTVTGDRLAVLPETFHAERVSALKSRLAAGQQDGSCVCDVITELGAEYLPAGGMVCRGCGSIFTPEGGQAGDAVVADSIRIVRVRAGRELIEAVEVYRQGAPLDMVGGLRRNAIDACARFRAVMGWGEPADLNISHAMYWAGWARDMFSELA